MSLSNQKYKIQSTLFNLHPNEYNQELHYYPFAVKLDRCAGNFNTTASKVSKQGVISGPYFPVFGLTTGKYGPEMTAYLDTFHAVGWSNKVSVLNKTKDLNIHIFNMITGKMNQKF